MKDIQKTRKPIVSKAKSIPNTLIVAAEESIPAQKRTHPFKPEQRKNSGRPKKKAAQKK